MSSTYVHAYPIGYSLSTHTPTYTCYVNESGVFTHGDVCAYIGVYIVQCMYITYHIVVCVYVVGDM